MKLDVVIPYGIEGIHWADNELRYALRSFEENFVDLGKVWIVGYKPAWITNVNYIKAYDPYKTNKDANLINKIITACQDHDLSTKFLFSSDDHIILEKVDTEYFEKPICDNRQIAFDRNARLNRWQKRIVNTEHALEARGFKKNCFEAHVPYMFDKHLYPHTLLQYDYGFDVGYTVSSLYYNSLNVPFKEADENTVARVNHQPKTMEELESLVADKLFFNYSTVAFGEIIKQFLANKFRKKSKFEL